MSSRSSLSASAWALASAALRTAPLLVLLLVLAATLAPSSNLGFVSDDYENVIEASASLPLTVSFDGLHRPLRNILFKASCRLFGANAVPYHLGIILLHLLAVAALYQFVLECHGGCWGAITTATLYGLFPRNHQVLFWVSAGQDSVVVICALVAGIAFLRYKRTTGLAPLLVVIATTLIALGFKETAVAIFPLLVLLDLCCGGRPLVFAWRIGVRVYLPLVLLGVIYLLWVKGYLWPGDMSQNFYSIQSLGQTLKMTVKFLLNMALPFFEPVEARQVLHRPYMLAAVLLAAVLGAAAIWRYVKPRQLLLAAGWLLLTAAPTVVLGFYTDRYLGLPFIGVALLLGFVARGAVASGARPGTKAVIVVLLCSYSLFSLWRLSTYESLWRSAALQVRATMAEARQKYPDVPVGSVIYFVNLTHTIASGQVYVFNGRLNGALWTSGYDRSVTAERTFDSDDSKERKLVRDIARCEDEALPAAQYIFVFKGSTAGTKSCAEEIIAASRRDTPDLWR